MPSPRDIIPSATSSNLPPPTCFEKLFSLGGQNSSRSIVYYIMFEFGCKVTNVAFNIGSPTIISVLGDGYLGNDQGAIVYTYLAVIVNIVTALCYLTITPLLDSCETKCNALVNAGFVCAFGLVLFILCFNQNALYFACLLVVICRVSQSIANVVFESLLDDVTKATTTLAVHASPSSYTNTASDPIPSPSPLVPVMNTTVNEIVVDVKKADEDGEALLAHLISSRSSFTGYVGMVSYVIFVAPIVAAVYFATKAGSLWVEGIIVNFVAGIWYAVSQVILSRNLAKSLLIASSSSELNNNESVGSNCLSSVLLGARNGLLAQWQTCRMLSMDGFYDLSFFIVAQIFMAAAASTALTVATIIATNILHASVFFLAAATFVGIIAAIVGLLIYRVLVDKHILRPKVVLILNAIVVSGAMVYVLYSKSVTDLFVIAAIVGTQVGPINAFSRSIVSRLTPTRQQSKFFSLYEFSQEATGWIGPLIIASLTVSYGGSGTVFARTSVFTCLMELGVAVLCLLPINVARGETHRFTIDNNEDNNINGAVAEVPPIQRAASASTNSLRPPDMAITTTNKEVDASPSFNHSSF